MPPTPRHHKRRIRLAATLALLGAAALAALPAGADIGGCWISEAGTSVIELSDDAGVVTGRIVGLEEPRYLPEEDEGTPGAPRMDLNNPEAELRRRPVAGLAIVNDLVRDDDEWVDGTIYDPQSGKTYAAKAELKRDGSLGLRGYIGAPMFGRTTRWTPSATRPEDTARMVAKLAPLMPGDAPAPDCTGP
ncbi:MAG TPA: DUF2147 domain-containing protein [Pseudomonadales bacterium]|nr:DUF2147 domain-containing protein [Pseudomonadales bacterium]